MFDPATLADYLAAKTPQARAEAVRDKLGANLTVEIKDGGTTKYSGTFTGPLKAGSEGTLFGYSNLTGAPPTQDTPDADTWTFRIGNGTNYIEGSFGPGGRFDSTGFDSKSMRLNVAIKAPVRRIKPAWMDDVPLLTWAEIPNTKMTSAGSGTGITAYSGATYRGTTMLVFGGGHTDYKGNEVIALDLSADEPAWTRIGEPTVSPVYNYPYQADGLPSSRHTYWSLHWVERHNRLFLMGGVGSYDTDYEKATSFAMDGFDPDTGDWDPGQWDGDLMQWDYSIPASWPQVPRVQSGKGSVCTDTHIWETVGSKLWRCDLTTMQWTDCGTMYGSGEPDTMLLHDPKRNRLFRPYKLYNGSSPQYFDLDGYAGGMPPYTDVAFTGADMPASWKKNTLTYCAERDSYLAYEHMDATWKIREINPDTFAVSVLSLSGDPPAAGNRMYRRFWYIPELRCVIAARNASTNVFFFRTG